MNTKILIVFLLLIGCTQLEIKDANIKQKEQHERSGIEKHFAKTDNYNGFTKEECVDAGQRDGHSYYRLLLTKYWVLTEKGNGKGKTYITDKAFCCYCNYEYPWKLAIVQVRGGKPMDTKFREKFKDFYKKEQTHWLENNEFFFSRSRIQTLTKDQADTYMKTHPDTKILVW